MSGRVVVVAALVSMWGCTGDSPFDPDAQTPASVPDRWYRLQNGFVSACPLALDDIVVYPTTAGTYVARDRRSGDVRWTAEVPGARHAHGASSLAVGDVIVASGGFEVRGLDARTGRLRWTYAPPSALSSRTVMAADTKGTVYVPAAGGAVNAVNAATGDERWIWSVGDDWPYYGSATGAAVSGDSVFVTAWQALNENALQRRGWLFVLDGASGEELMRVELPFAPFEGAPVVWQDLVVVAYGAGRMIAVDRRTGEIAWDHQPPAEHAGASTPALLGSTLYLDGTDGWLYAVSAATGATIWKAEYDGGTPLWNPRVSDRRVYLPYGQRLRIYDAESGRLVRETVQGHGVPEVYSTFGCPTASGGDVFVAVSDAAWSFVEP